MLGLSRLLKTSAAKFLACHLGIELRLPSFPCSSPASVLSNNTAYTGRVHVSVELETLGAEAHWKCLIIEATHSPAIQDQRLELSA